MSSVCVLTVDSVVNPQGSKHILGKQLSKSIFTLNYCMYHKWVLNWYNKILMLELRTVQQESCCTLISLKAGLQPVFIERLVFLLHRVNCLDNKNHSSDGKKGTLSHTLMVTHSSSR